MDTQRLEVEFVDLDGDISNVTELELNVYDVNNVLLDTIDTGIINVSTGKYYYDYEIDTTMEYPLEGRFTGILNEKYISRKVFIKRNQVTYELKSHLLGWVKAFCHNDFVESGVEKIPSGIEIFLIEAVKFYTDGGYKTSESLGDYSVAFAAGPDGIPPQLLVLLYPYRKMGTIS